jgi:hypothetical protein
MAKLAHNAALGEDIENRYFFDELTQQGILHMSEHIVILKCEFRQGADVATAVADAKIPGITVKDTAGTVAMLIEAEPTAIEELVRKLGDRFKLSPVVDHPVPWATPAPG